MERSMARPGLRQQNQESLAGRDGRPCCGENCPPEPCTRCWSSETSRRPTWNRRPMWSFNYPAELQPEEGGQRTVRFVDLPEAITSGEEGQDALRQAADCLEEAIAGRIADGLDLPQPSPSPPSSTTTTRVSKTGGRDDFIADAEGVSCGGSAPLRSRLGLEVRHPLPGVTPSSQTCRSSIDPQSGSSATP